MSPRMHSRRAQILMQVLEYIDRGDWDHYDGFLVFGKEAFEQLVGWSDDEPNGISGPLGEFAVKRKRNAGDRIISERTSLSVAPADTTKADIQDLVASLPEETMRLIAENANIIASAVGRKPTNQDAFDAEALDSALAEKAIRMLDGSFARLSTWDEIEIDQASVRNPEYFEEAHNCDLFGLKVACAVLCRAVLEEALKEKVDPTGAIERSKLPKQSHIELMLDQAVKDGRIDKERREAGIRIRNAGN